MKSIVSCLLSVVLAFAASAQEPASPVRSPRRMTIPGRSTMLSRQPASAGGAAADAAAGDEGGRSIEFNAAPVDMVFTVYQDLVGKTVLKDPQTPAATITLQPKKGQELSDKEKIEAIETVLEMNGIHLEPYGEKFVRAIPRKGVRKDGIPLYLDSDQFQRDVSAGLLMGGKTVSIMIKFKNVNITEAKTVLDGFKSDKSDQLIVFERNSSILVTDTTQNIEKMLQIAEVIDKPDPAFEIKRYERTMKYATAANIEKALTACYEFSKAEKEERIGKAANEQRRPSVPEVRPTTRLLTPRNQPNAAANATLESLFVSAAASNKELVRGKPLFIYDADNVPNKIIIITYPENMELFDWVIEQLDVETTPDTVVKVYRLKYAEAEDVSDMINDLIGATSSSKNSGKNNNKAQPTNTGKPGGASAGTPKKPANQRSGDVKAGELNKDNTTVLADKRINGLVVMTNRELVPTLEQIIESMDIKLSQVLIETCIIEVGLGDGIETGMDWVQHGRQQVQKDATTKTGSPLYYKSRTITRTNDQTGETKTTTSILSDMVESGYSYNKTTTDGDWTTKITESASELAGQASAISTDGLLNYYTAGSATAIAGGQGGEAAYNIAKGVTSNIFGKALNFVFTSDELGLTAILQATKTDSRSKYIASPVIMTLDNKEAVINATAMHYLLKGFTSSGNSYSTIAVPDYEQKELGIEIKVTPKINPNGTVMLTVEEKYTQLGPDEYVQYSTGTGGGLGTVPAQTTITREMSSDVILENNQTVVFGGLTETTTSESETGIPFLKDIPYIGKWLFGTVKQSESRTELLVFMTPYVLDDAQAAQAEALRRKRAMSDPNPWDDHGWSLSELADPVSKKEQVRRLKDEWKKQDEERRSRQEIEKLKVKRMKELEAMSKDERNAWLKLHKEELEKSEREELEEKMLDDKSQEELKKLAEKVKADRLRKADKAIREAERDASQRNERAKRDAERKEAKESDDKRDKRPVSRDSVVSQVTSPQVSRAPLAPQVKTEAEEKK